MNLKWVLNHQYISGLGAAEHTVIVLYIPGDIQQFIFLIQ